VTSYHVTLDGQGLILDLGTYRKQVAPPFADKVAQGDRTYQDLFFEQVWQLGDWSGGDGVIGYLHWDAGRPDRYRSGSGVDGYSQPGSLQVGPDLVSSGAPANNGYTVLQPFKGKLYAGTTDGKIYEWNGASWALSRDTAKAGGIRAMAVYKGKLYAGNGTDGVVDSFDGTTWTAAAFTVTGVSGVRSMAVFDVTSPTLYVGASIATGAGLYRYNGSTVSAVLYNAQEPDVYAMAIYGGYLWFFGADASSRRGSVYRTDTTSFDRRLDLPENYVTAAIVHQGLVFLGMGAGGELWSFDGTAQAVVAKDLTASGDELRGLAVWQRALWVSTRNGGEIRLKRYEAGSNAWSEPAGGGSVNSSSGGAQGMATLGADLYVAGQKSGTAAPIYKVSSGVYPTAAKTLESGLFSANLGSDNKVFRSVTLNHAALVSGQSVQVQYRLEDSGSWTTLGTSATAGATSATFSFAAGAVGKLIALRLVLTATAAATPVLYEALVRYAPAPATKREWRFEALFEGSADLPLITLDGQADPKTGPQIAAAVWASKAKSGPLTYVDLDGTTYSAWLLELREGVTERSQRRGYSTRGVVRLLEA
jgi:hypothetical protein